MGHGKLVTIPSNDKPEVLMTCLLATDGPGYQEKSEAGEYEGRTRHNLLRTLLYCVGALSLIVIFKRSTLELGMQFSGRAHA